MFLLRDADEQFLKDAFKNGTVSQSGVKLVETSVFEESSEQPTTATKSDPYGNCPNCGVGRMRQYSHSLWRCNKCGNETTGNFS